MDGWGWESYRDTWCFPPAHSRRHLGSSSPSPGSLLPGCRCGWGLRWRNEKRCFYFCFRQQGALSAAGRTRKRSSDEGELLKPPSCFSAPFLAPVLYSCHSASAAGEVPKNSPTQSSSCRGTRRQWGGRRRKAGRQQTHVKLSRLLLDGLDSAEEGAQSAFHVTARQPADEHGNACYMSTFVTCRHTLHVKTRCVWRLDTFKQLFNVNM